jgi:predicted nucleotidyltransferase
MLDFIKNTTGEILKLFFLDPEKEYYLREIGKNLGREPGVFQRNMADLLKEGILKDKRRGNLRFFRLNKKHPLYEEIKSIVSKTLGIEAQLKKLADSLKGVECAFIFGSIAKGAENSYSDIDLMLIGNIDQDDLTTKIIKLEDDLEREINYHIFDKEEVVQRLRSNNEFFLRIFNEPIILLKGSLNGFGEFNKSGASY